MLLVRQGDLFTLLSWQRLFPTVLMRSQPEVRLAIAWGMALAIRCDEALELLGEIERDIGANHSPDGQVVRCECRQYARAEHQVVGDLLGRHSWVMLQIILVVIVILWPQSVTYWIERGTGLDPSKIKIEIPMPEAPPPLDFGEPPKVR
jgi:hypothetical protein